MFYRLHDYQLLSLAKKQGQISQFHEYAMADLDFGISSSSLETMTTPMTYIDS